MISKRDRTLIYHQRIISLTAWPSAPSGWVASGASQFDLEVLLRSLAKNISKSIKKSSREFWGRHTNSKECLRRDKYYVVAWWE